MKKILTILFLLSQFLFGEEMDNDFNYSAFSDIEVINAGEKIMTLRNDDKVFLWNVKSREIINKIDLIEYGGGFSTNIAISSDSKNLAVGSELGDVYIINLNDEKYPFIYKGLHMDRITGIEFITNNKKVVTCSYDGNINLIDSHSYLITKHIVMSEKITALGVTKDGEELIIGTDKGNIHFLRSKDLKKSYSIYNAHGDSVLGIKCSPTDDLIATIGWDGKAKIISTPMRRIIGEQILRKNISLNSIDWNDNNKIIVSSSDTNVYVLNFEKNGYNVKFEIENVLYFHTDRVNKAISLKSTNEIVCIGNDSELVFWSMENYEVLENFKFE